MIPDAFLALDYMLDRFAWIVDGLVVYPERMERNLWASHGLFFSHRLLLALVESGLERGDAYRLVQRNAMRAWDEERDFRELVRADAAITAHARRRRARQRLRPRRDRRQPRQRRSTVSAASSRRRNPSMSEALHVGSGKVRELYALDDDRLLLVASDRISTFDVILPTEIPDKGRVLTGLSGFWFARTTRARREPPARAARATAARPSAGGSRCCRSSASCAATSSGSGWKDYRATGEVCGHRLPEGLVESQQLPGADLHAGDEGRDRPRREHRPRRRGRARRRGALRRGRGDRARALPLRLGVRRASAGSSSPTRSSSSASTSDGRLVLGDEAFTPDSSRFWPADEYTPGAHAAVVRQAVRPRLLRVARLGQDRSGPRAAGRRRRRAPARRYIEAFEQLTGIAFDTTSPTRAWCSREGDRARPAEAGHPRPAGAGRRELAAPPRLRGRRGARRPARRRRARRPTTATRRGRSSSGCASSC